MRARYTGGSALVKYALENDPLSSSVPKDLIDAVAEARSREKDPVSWQEHEADEILLGMCQGIVRAVLSALGPDENGAGSVHGAGRVMVQEGAHKSDVRALGGATGRDRAASSPSKGPAARPDARPTGRRAGPAGGGCAPRPGRFFRKRGSPSETASRVAPGGSKAAPAESASSCNRMR